MPHSACPLAGGRWQASTSASTPAPANAAAHPARKRRAACAGGPRKHGQRGKHAQHITSSAAATSRLLPTQLAANSGARLASPHAVSNAGNQDPVHRSRLRNPAPRPAGWPLAPDSNPRHRSRFAARRLATCAAAPRAPLPVPPRFPASAGSWYLALHERHDALQGFGFVFCGCAGNGRKDILPSLRDGGGTAAGAGLICECVD